MDKDQLSETKLAMDHLDFASVEDTVVPRCLLCLMMINNVAIVQVDYNDYTST